MNTFSLSKSVGWETSNNSTGIKEVGAPASERLALTSTLVCHSFNSNADHRLYLPWSNVSVCLSLTPIWPWLSPCFYMCLSHTSLSFSLSFSLCLQSLNLPTVWLESRTHMLSVAWSYPAADHAAISQIKQQPAVSVKTASITPR